MRKPLLRSWKYKKVRREEMKIDRHAKSQGQKYKYKPDAWVLYRRWDLATHVHQFQHSG